MYPLIASAIKDGAPASEEIIFDFTYLNFVKSAGVVILSNLVEWLRKRGVTVSYANCTRTKPAIAYLDDVGFFAAYWGNSLSPEARIRSTTYPFRRLQCINSHQWIDGNVFPWIADKLSVKFSALNEFKTSVRELFNNISDHSAEQVGCMHVQWYPNIERMKIAISDFGVGIPAEVRKVREEVTDYQALCIATQEGFSSRPGRNMGAGLNYIVDNIVKRYKGWVGIYSGGGFITFNHVYAVGSGVSQGGFIPAH